MMLGHIFTEKIKAFHVVIAQLVRILIRSLELFYRLKSGFLNLQKSIVYLLVLQFTESLLSIDGLL